MTIAGAHGGETALRASRAPLRLPAGRLAALLIASVIIVMAPTVKTMASLWFGTAAYYHAIFVAPAAIWLARRLGPAENAPQHWPIALMGVAGSLALWLAGRAASANIIEQAAFVSLLIAIFAFVYGPAWVKHWRFPLALLLFMIPSGDALLPMLQQVAAQSVVFALNLTGYTASLDGVVITANGYRFGIAESCAGLNFLIAAVMVAALFAHFAFRGWKKAALFVTAAAAAAIAANILRVYVIVALATLSHGRIALGVDHVLIGWGLYAVLLFALVAAGKRFADKPLDAAHPAHRSFEPLPLAPASAALILLLFAGAWDRAVIAGAPTNAPLPSLSPIEAAGWTRFPEAEGWSASLDHADMRAAALYESHDFLVLTHFAWFAWDRPGAEIAGYDTKSYDGEEWRRMASRRRNFTAFGGKLDLPVHTIENARRTRLETITLYWFDGELYADPARLKLAVAKNRILGRKPSGGAIVLAAPADHGAAAALQAFLMTAEPFDSWLARLSAAR